MKKKLPFFVYGTLKQGRGNDHRLKCKVEKIEKAVLKDFDMYSLGGFPAIIKGNSIITGELVFVKDEVYENTLKSLDSLEGFHEEGYEGNMYNRKVAFVELENGEQVEAYYYEWNREGLERNRKIKNGIW